jgi:hypothetical protein
MTPEEAAMVVPGDELWAVYIVTRCCVKRQFAMSPAYAAFPDYGDNLWVDVIDEDHSRSWMPVSNLYRSREEAERDVMVEAMKSP